MKKIKILLLGLCLLLGFGTAAQAGPIGDVYAIFTFQGAAPYRVEAGDFTISNAQLGANIFNDGGLTGSFNYIADPRIEYSFGFVNGAAVLPFSVQFVIEDFTPALTGQTQQRAQVAVAVTDNPDAGWFVNTNELAPYLQTNFVDTDPATGLVAFAELGAANSGEGFGVFGDQTPPNGLTFISGPTLTGDYTDFITGLSAEVSAFDGFTFTGNCELTSAVVVPIPGSVLLLGGGLLGLAGLRLRSRN